MATSFGNGTVNGQEYVPDNFPSNFWPPTALECRGSPECRLQMSMDWSRKVYEPSPDELVLTRPRSCVQINDESKLSLPQKMVGTNRNCN